MQLTGELAPLGYAHRQTEFIIAPVGPDTGKLIYGACGPTALGSAASAARQKLVSTGDAYAVMEPRGLCDASGVTTDGKIATAAAALGLTIAEHHGAVVINNVVQHWNGWQTFLGWHLGSCDHPTVIEVSNGQALVDAISGQGENATNLQEHFICLVKRHAGGYSQYAGKSLPSGYWACDGDSYAGGNSRANQFAAADVLQFYSDTVLTSANPIAGIAFNRAAGAIGGGAVAGVPTGWKDDGVTLTAPNGVAVVKGFRDWVLAHAHDPNDVPLEAEFSRDPIELGNPSLGAGVVQYFKQSGQMGWTTAMGVYKVWDGQEEAGLYTALLAARQQVTSLEAQIAQLQAELAALKAQPAPTPQPAPLTPQQQAAIDLVASLKTALA